MLCRNAACYEELPVCIDCLNDLRNILSEKCKNCGKSAAGCDCSDNGSIRFLFFYEKYKAQKLIYFIKTNVDRTSLDFIVELLFENCGINPERYEAVTFVPRRKRTIRRYGHDQSKELAKAIERVYGIPCVKTLSRVGRGEQKLLSAKARYKNIKKKYKLAKEFPKEARFKRILLIDDVFTTGATIKACAELLRGAVSEAVVPLVLAKTNYLKK